MSKLKNLFNPQSIAIVGASEEEGKVGNVIAKNVLALGYVGKVFLVNPKHETLLGQKCYQSLNEIEVQVDLAIIVIPAKFVNDLIREAKDKVKNYIIISAGFAESSEEGKAREKELKIIATENNLNILGPNCLGFIVPQLKLNASFAGGMPEAGNIAFVSQSGALAVALMDVAKKKSLQFSSIISVGNKMKISESELLEHLNEDQDTKVIGMYLEGIKDGQKFIEVVSQIKKPIVILKAGKTEKSQKAISSHTGALAGNDEIINAVFAKIGVIRVQNLDEFLEILKLSSISPVPQNEEVIAVTNAGGLGVLTADAFQDKKIRLAEISEKSKTALRKFLPKESSLANPVDVLGDADEKKYAKTLDVLKKENAGTIICLLTPQDQTPVKKIASKIIKFKKNIPIGENKNILTVFMGGKRMKKAITKLRENNVPNFFLAEQAVNTLDKYYRWSKRTAISEKMALDYARKEKAEAIITQAKNQGRSALLFAEAAEIMNLYNINIVETFLENSAEIKFPVVVKVDSDKVLHKTDRQGLISNIKNSMELTEAIMTIKNNFPGENFIIQSLQKIKTELILGIKKDDIFGPIVVFGLGGIYTEVFKMVDFLVPPASVEEIKRKLLESKIKFLFQETRGQKPYDLSELAKTIEQLQFLAQELPKIKELDINPLLIYNDDTAGVAVDVKIII